MLPSSITSLKKLKVMMSLFIKFQEMNVDNPLSQRNTRAMLKNSIKDLRKEPVPPKDTLFQTVLRTSLFHSSVPSKLLNSKNLLKQSLPTSQLIFGD